MVVSITELAEVLGVRTDTLRYYERLGLIESAGRTPANYRLFDASTVERVRFIKDAQRSGLRLRDIAQLLAVMDSGDCPCGHTSALVAARVAELDHELETLESLRARLVELKRANDACLAPSVDAWQCQVAATTRGGDAE